VRRVLFFLLVASSVALMAVTAIAIWDMLEAGAASATTTACRR